MADFDNFDDLDNPLQALLNELADLDEVSRRRRVHETARDMVGLPHETFTAYRDALVAAGYVRSSDFTTTYREEQRRQQQAARDAAREAGEGEEGEGRGPSQATQLVAMALEHYELGVTVSDDTYAVPREGPRIPKMVRGPGLLLRPELEARYHDERDAVPNAQSLTEAVSMLDSKARRADPVELHLRVARFDDGLIVDMGDAAGRVVEITSRGWQVLDATPGPLFGRTRVTKALPEPARDGTLDDLRAAVNVTDISWPLIAASLVQALIPDASHPIVLLRGQQGAGKSTRARHLGDLIDPSSVPLRKPPKDDHGWVVAAAASWGIAIDNISTIPGWLSDSLCRAVTGEGDIRRALYTDGNITVFEFRRWLLLTSIDAGSLAGDLADRLLAVECAPISEEERREDADLAAEWAQLYPRALGALYDLAVRVLAELPHVRPRRLPRMADYGRVLATVDAVLDTNGLATYYRQAEDLASEVLDSSPIAAAVVRLVHAQPDHTWSGTPTALLNALKRVADDVEGTARRSAGWPTSPRALSAQLTRLEPSLKRVHKITVAHSRGSDRSHARIVTLQVEPSEGKPGQPSEPSEPSDTASDQQERSDGCSDGRSASDGRPSEASDGSDGRGTAGGQPSDQPSEPGTASDLREHSPSDGADGSDGSSGVPSEDGVGALRAAEAGGKAGHVASPAPEASVDPNEPMDLAKMKAILLAEGARRRAAVNGDRLATFDQLPDEEP